MTDPQARIIIGLIFLIILAVFYALVALVGWLEGREQKRVDEWYKKAHKSGWLCRCGNWLEDSLHCEHCGAEPPQGCDCGWCEDRRHEHDEYMDDAEWLSDWADYPADLLAGELKDEKQ